MSANGGSRERNFFPQMRRFSRDGGIRDELAVDQYLVEVVNSVQCSCLICKDLVSHGRSPLDWSREAIRWDEDKTFEENDTRCCGRESTQSVIVVFNCIIISVCQFDPFDTPIRNLVLSTAYFRNNQIPQQLWTSSDLLSSSTQLIRHESA